MKSSRCLIPLLAALALSACGTLGNRPQAPAIERGESVPAPSQSAPAQVPGGKRGGYYLDDGPGDNPPPNIDEIPDATPRNEPPLARANRPYVALGESYTPMTEYQSYRAQGVASWYGRRYHGQKTSSGEVYDMYGMTAAHTTLPIPSYARITNPENGRSVVVRVNDRGPFKKDRLIDLSYAAAYKLRLTGKGSGQVVVEAIDTRNRSVDATVAQNSAPAALASSSDRSFDSPSGPFVQVGAFKLKENADQLRQRLQQQSLARDVGVENWYNDGVYRVRLGPYTSREDAERAAGRIRQALGLSTLIITQ